MPDALGYRKKFGALIPSANTVFEPELHMMRVHGVTVHTARIRIPSGDLSTDEAANQFHANSAADYKTAVETLLTSEPDHIVMGHAAPMFLGGKSGHAAQFKQLSTIANGIGVTTPPEACEKALRALGVRRIAILSPFQPTGDAAVREFFTDCGFDVVKFKGLRTPKATAIARITEDELRSHLKEINTPQVQALLQVGTNVACAKLCDEAERWLGKPVLSINAVTWWAALRNCGITDKLYGYGSLLHEF